MASEYVDTKPFVLFATELVELASRFFSIDLEHYKAVTHNQFDMSQALKFGEDGDTVTV